MLRKIFKTTFTLILIFTILLTQTGLVYAVTFTAGQAKRDAPGPFTAAPIIQGDPNNLSSLTDDVVSASRGTQVSGNFYADFDGIAGSVVLWWTPEFAYDSLSGTSDHYLWYISSNYFLAYEYDNDRYNLTVGGQSMTVASNVAAGTTYSLVARWDTQNVIQGTNYAGLSIDDTHSFGVTSAPTAGAPDATIYIGGNGTTGSGSGIVEGLTIYRRVLYDGTNGINAGNGDEINLIYASGAGKDPTLVTGSWDVVFALPTDSSTGALSTGTGNAWTHPHLSNLLYTSTTNTGGFMLNGTYTTDGWADEGTPTSVGALASTEKIYAGGYKTTSDAANEGIYYDKTVVAGDDWVVRALAHSDGTSSPSAELWDQTHNVPIATQSGTTTSTRTAPNTFIFTGEAPSAMTTLRVKLLNSAASGVTYWHQVEVLSNLISNPSVKSGSGDPWTPTGWSAYNLAAGEGSQDTSDYHSGASSVHMAAASSNWSGYTFGPSNYTAGNFLSAGVWSKRTTDGVCATNELIPPYLRYSFATGSSWTLGYRVIPTKSGAYDPMVCYQQWGAYDFRFDDAYAFMLTNVSLTVTPADQTNSTENTDEIRVDGRDTYTASSAEATSITTTTGYTSFNWRPRHAAADSVKFAETTSDDAYIVSFAGDSNDYINIYWDSANTIAMAYNMNGTSASGTWTATGAIAANTEYAVALSYTGGSTMTLSVGGTTRITLSSIPAAFGTAPNNPVYFGSDTSSSNQGDATFSSIVFDNTAPSISLTALSPDPNNDTTPALTGTATEAIGTVSDVEFQMDSTAGAWTDCTADDAAFDEASEPFTCTVTSALSAGSHTMYVRATDSNSNTTAGGSESSDTFTIDATAPTISVTALTPDPTTDTTPSITGTATDATTALTAIQYQVDSTGGSWTTCTADDGAIDETSEAYTCTTSALSDGSHTIYIRATDSASNTTALANYGTDTFTVDSGGPTVTLTVYTPDPTTDSTPTISGSATDTTGTVSTVQFQVDSTTGTWISCTADDSTFDEATETFTCTPPAGGALSDGSHTIYVRATDNASNTSTNASDTFTVDTTRPVAFSIESPSNNSYINSERPSFSWKGGNDVTSGLNKYKLEVDGPLDHDFSVDSIEPSRTSNKDSNTYYATYSNFTNTSTTDDTISLHTKDSSDWSSNQNRGKLKEGKTTLKVTAYDNAGNSQEESASFIADFTNPSISAAFKEITITGSIYDSYYPEKVEISIFRQTKALNIVTAEKLYSTTNLNLNNTTNKQTITFTSTLETPLSYGSYRLEVKGYDKAGNSSIYTILKNISPITTETIEDTSLQPTEPKPPSVSIPELEKKAKIVNEKRTDEFKQTTKDFITNIRNFITQEANLFSQALTSITTNISSLTPKIVKDTTSTINSLSNTLTTSLDKSQQVVKDNIQQTYNQSTTRLTKTKDALTTATRSFAKPIQEGTGVLERTKIWLLTFESIVFDPSPTTISNITIEELGSDYAVVSWETNHYAWGKVNYGEDLMYGEEVILTKREKYHRAKLTGLTPGKHYFFEVMSQNKNYVYDAYYTFETVKE